MTDITRDASPCDAFKVDEPVMVRDNREIEWKRRYFAGVSPAGKPRTFPGGLTSWSANEENASAVPTVLVQWDQCRRPTPEELANRRIV